MNEPLVPPPAPVPHRRRALMWWGGGVTVLAVLIAGGSYAYFQDVFSLHSQLEARILMQHVRVVKGPLKARVLGEYDTFGTYRVLPSPPNDELVEYMRFGKSEFFLTRNQDTGTSTVSVVTANKNKLLVTSTSSILWIGVAPDGQTLTYAERDTLNTGGKKVDATAVYDPSTWSIHVMNLRTGVSQAIVRGSVPRLFDYKGMLYVMYLVPGAVHMRSLTDGREFALTSDIDGLWPAEVSRDGTHLALFNQKIMSYELFTFELKDGKITTQLLPQPKSQLRILTFVKSYVIALAWNPTTKKSYLVVVDLNRHDKETTVRTEAGLDDIRKIIPSP